MADPYVGGARTPTGAHPVGAASNRSSADRLGPGRHRPCVLAHLGGVRRLFLDRLTDEQLAQLATIWEAVGA